MRQWRVGTISMGVLLITTGILLMLQRINGISTIAIILRWWPIILILIGAEVLVYSYFSKEEVPKVKYDGLSIFIVVILIIFSMGAYTLSSLNIGEFRTTFFNSFPGMYKYESNYTKNLTIDPKASVKLSASNAYGNMEIEQSTSKKIEIEAEIKIRNNDEAYAKKISEKLIEVKATDGIKIISKVKDYLNDRTKIQNITVNLKVKVPAGMEVSLENEYGDITARDVTKALTISDKNGRVTTNTTGGNLKIDNQYGDIDVTDVLGSCEVNDKNGQVEINNVGKNLMVFNEYGNITVDRVKGDVNLKDKNADIKVNDISGSVVIDNKYGNININNVQGSVSLKDKNGSIEIEAVGGNVKTINEYGNVSISDAHKGVEIIDKNGNIDIESDKPLEENIDIENSYGNITLDFPENQNAFIKANTSYGEINTEFDLSVSDKNNKKSVNQQLGTGGIKIDLKTKNGNIDIR